MVALLILLPTLAFAPIYFFAFPAFYILLRKVNQEGWSYFAVNFQKINKNFLIILLIVLATAINKVVNHYDDLTIFNFLPYTVVIPIAYFIAKHLRKKDLELLVFFIVVEALVVMVQYFLGTNTFFSGLDQINQQTEGRAGLLYYRRPYGLSMNSSVVAYKLFLAYLILDFLKLKQLIHTVFRLLLLVAIYFTFNRTIFLAMAIYFTYSALKVYGPVIDQLLSKRIFKYQVKYILFAAIGLVGLIFIVSLYTDAILNQLTRGKTKSVDLSGRDHIWAGFIDFINNNFFFGNGSEKHYVLHGESMAHAHNSYLQLMATHGIFIALLYIWLVLRNLTKYNFIFILSILIYSSFQYGIFWGISLMDIILFKLLFFYNRKEASTAIEKRIRHLSN